jgi:outer membrane protein TolC
VAQQRLVRALSEYARLARLQFNGGYTSYTTVLQAEQQLFPSELNLATIRARLYALFAPQPDVEALPERASAAARYEPYDF